MPRGFLMATQAQQLGMVHRISQLRTRAPRLFVVHFSASRIEGQRFQRLDAAPLAGALVTGPHRRAEGLFELVLMLLLSRPIP